MDKNDVGEGNGLTAYNTMDRIRSMLSDKDIADRKGKAMDEAEYNLNFNREGRTWQITIWQEIMRLAW